MAEAAAGVRRPGNVDRCITLFDVRNLAFRIDHEGRAIGDAPVGHQNSVGLRGFAIGEIAEEREGEGILL